MKKLFLGLLGLELVVAIYLKFLSERVITSCDHYFDYTYQNPLGYDKFKDVPVMCAQFVFDSKPHHFYYLAADVFLITLALFACYILLAKKK